MIRRVRITRIGCEFFREQTDELTRLLKLQHNPATPLICLRYVYMHSQGEDFICLLCGRNAGRPPSLLRQFDVSFFFRIDNSNGTPKQLIIAKRLKVVEKDEESESVDD